MSLRTDTLKNFTTDILDIAVNQKNAPNPGKIAPKDLDAVLLSIPSGGGGITTNEVIRAMDLSITLVDQAATLTEADYSDENIDIMIELLDKLVYGGEEI